MFNIFYMGNWGRGRSCLEALYRMENVRILAVFTQYVPESEDIYCNLVHDFSISQGMPVFNIYGLKSSQVNSLIVSHLDQCGQTDVIGVSVAFEKIFKPDLLARLRIINLHPSWLPKYRGPSPELWAIKNGELYIGITLHWVDEGIDRGNILYQDRFELDYNLSYMEFADWLNFEKSPAVLNDFFSRIKTLEQLGVIQDQPLLYFRRIPVGREIYQLKLHEIRNLLQGMQGQY